ncbi:hypothetical protein GGI20_005988, partial [Coemansia sp. BCRC 34301]
IRLDLWLADLLIPRPTDMIFGLDTTLFALSERLTVGADSASAASSTASGANGSLAHYLHEVDLIEIRRSQSTSLTEQGICSARFIAFLSSLPVNDVYRIKGIVRLVGSIVDNEAPPDSTNKGDSALYIVNHAFGRYTFTCLTSSAHLAPDVLVRVTILGSGLRVHLSHLLSGFMASESETTAQWAQRPE